jgi:hypothetical protein
VQRAHPSIFSDLLHPCAILEMASSSLAFVGYNAHGCDEQEGTRGTQLDVKSTLATLALYRNVKQTHVDG